MNTIQAFEIAVRNCLAVFGAEAVPVSWLHCSSIPTDGDNASGLQAYPQMRIAVGGKEHAEDGVTWSTAITITCETLSEDDQDAAQLNGMYEAVETFFEHLIDGDADDEVVEHFNAQMRQSMPSFCLGRFVPSASDGILEQEQSRLVTFAGAFEYDY